MRELQGAARLRRYRVQRRRRARRDNLQRCKRSRFFVGWLRRRDRYRSDFGSSRVSRNQRQWVFRASTSYLQIDGPADVADVDAGAGDGTRGQGEAAATPVRSGTERGIGDTNLSLSRTFRHVGGSDAYIETTARVRLPTGDEDAGLGVGATDYQLAGEVGVNKRGGGGSIEVARRFLGDRAGVEREDGWQVSGNTWIRTGERHADRRVRHHGARPLLRAATILPRSARSSRTR